MQEEQVRLNRINVVTTAIDMLFIVAVTIVFNFIPHIVGIYNLPAAESFRPLLTPEFQIVLPWLNIWWGLAFTLDLVRLIQRRQTFGTCWLDCGLHVYGAVLLGWLALDPRFMVREVWDVGRPLLGLMSVVLLIWVARRVSIARCGERIVLELRRL
jgi:hypothetical protein